jgi:hypothetical protein
MLHIFLFEKISDLTHVWSNGHSLAPISPLNRGLTATYIFFIYVGHHENSSD